MLPTKCELACAPPSVSRPVTTSRGTNEAFRTGAEEAGQHFEGCMTNHMISFLVLTMCLTFPSELHGKRAKARQDEAWSERFQEECTALGVLPAGSGSARTGNELASGRTALAEEDTAGHISSSGLSPLRAGASGKRELGFHNSHS